MPLSVFCVALVLLVSGVAWGENSDHKDTISIGIDVESGVEDVASVAEFVASSHVASSGDGETMHVSELARQLFNNNRPHELFDAHSETQLGYWWADKESRCETHARTEFVVLDDTWEVYRRKKGSVVRTLKRSGYDVKFELSDKMLETLAAAPSLPPLLQVSFPARNLERFIERLSSVSDPYVEDACGGRLKVYLNHLCAGCNKLVLKARLHSSYNENKSRREGLGEFLLETFFLPDDLSAFVKSAWREGESDDVRWILKPYHGGMGAGHRILDRMELRTYGSRLAERVANGETLPLGDNNIGRIAQRVLHNPMMMARRKFDLRAIATVSSMDPLLVWVSPKIRTYAPRMPYRAGSKDKAIVVGNNVDGLNLKTMEEAHGFDDIVLHTDQRVRWTMTELKSWLAYSGLDPEPLWRKIKDAIVGTVLITNSGVADYFEGRPRLWEHTYEHFGWDFAIRDNLDPVVFEVNYEPDLKDQYGQVVSKAISEYLLDEIRLVAPNPPIFRFGDPYYRSLEPLSFLAEYHALRKWVSQTIGLESPIPWCTDNEKTRRNKAILDDPLRLYQRPASTVDSEKYTPRGYFVDLDAFPASTFLDCITFDDIEVIVDAEEHLLRSSSFELASFPFNDPFRFARLYPTRRNILLARWFELSRSNRTAPIKPYYFRDAFFNTRDEYELLEVKDHRLYLSDDDGDNDDDDEFLKLDMDDE